MINTNFYCESIRKKSEADLKSTIIDHLQIAKKECLVEDSFDLIEGNFDFFICFLKEFGIYVKCICDAPFEEAREFLTKMLNCFNIMDKNIDETLEYIKVNSTFHPKRISDWTTSEIEVITGNQEKVNFNCYCAEFKDINNWEQEFKQYKYKLVCHKKQILWLTSSVEPVYFFIKKRKYML